VELSHNIFCNISTTFFFFFIGPLKEIESLKIGKAGKRRSGAIASLAIKDYEFSQIIPE